MDKVILICHHKFLRGHKDGIKQQCVTHANTNDHVRVTTIVPCAFIHASKNDGLSIQL